MSLFPRLLLAAVATLFGLAMLAAASVDEKAAVFTYAFGGFCMAVAVACVAPGRVAQFFGSLVALVVVLLGIWYVGSMLGAGTLWSGSRVEPSLVNAAAFLVVFGLPSVAYIWRARFGFGPAETAISEAADGDSWEDGR